MKSKIIIVDENDNEIGIKARGDIDYSNDIYRSTALWLTNSKGEVLLAQRKLTKDKDPGMWGPAASGTVDEGETYDSNVYKEAEEEIGLTGIHFEKAAKTFLRYTRSHFVQWYTAVVDKDLSEFTIQEDEVEKLAWVAEEELLHDLHNNPTKYIPTMPQIVEMFCQEA
jgi:isopentenyldiphosphate isomerase